MSKEITRTISITVATVACVVDDESGAGISLVDREFMFIGKRDSAYIAKELIKLGTAGKVKEISVRTQVYGMTVEEFVANAHIVTRSPSQTANRK